MIHTRANSTARAGLLCAALTIVTMLSAPAFARTTTQALPELPAAPATTLASDNTDLADVAETRPPQALDGLRVGLLTLTGQPIPPELQHALEDDDEAPEADDADVLSDVREALGLDAEADAHADDPDASLWERSLGWLAEWLGVEEVTEAPDTTFALTVIQAQLTEQLQAMIAPRRRVPVRISSHFGKRFHPVLRRWKMHGGTDFAAPTGTPVMAVADGEVRLAGYYGAAGNYIMIKHDNGYTSQYMHLSRISRGVARGQRVRRGQLIGKVGTTGRSTGPHLHFGLKRHGVAVDPLKVQDFAYAAPIREMEREIAYRTRVKPLLARMDPELIRRANPETR